MTSRFSRARIAIFAIFMAADGVAAAQQARPGERWAVDGGELYCTLTRSTAGEAPGAFAVRVIPGSNGQSDLLISNSSRDVSPISAGDELELQLSPSDFSFKRRAVTGRLPSGAQFVAATNLDAEFLDGFAQSRELRVTRGGRVLLTLAFPSPERVVAVLRDCIDQTLVRWGADPRARAQLRQPARMVEGTSWLSGSDYPTSALQDDAVGIVVARLTIDVRGRVSDCAIVRSSRVDSLDRRTCAGARSDARYHPAIDSAGQPVASNIIVVVRWGIAG